MVHILIREYQVHKNKLTNKITKNGFQIKKITKKVIVVVVKKNTERNDIFKKLLITFFALQLDK